MKSPTIRSIICLSGLLLMLTSMTTEACKTAKDCPLCSGTDALGGPQKRSCDWNGKLDKHSKAIHTCHCK